MPLLYLPNLTQCKIYSFNAHIFLFFLRLAHLGGGVLCYRSLWYNKQKDIQQA